MIGVFNNYNPKLAGGVMANAFPNVQVYRWIPNKQTSPTGVNKLTTPTERGAWFVRQTPGNPVANGGCGCNPAVLEGGGGKQ